MRCVKTKRYLGGLPLTEPGFYSAVTKGGADGMDQGDLSGFEKVTIAPSAITQADVQRLRDVGWTDRDILDIVQVCAYFNFRVRVVDGLGLDANEAQVGRARAGRERAAALAKERGVELPADTWGLSEPQAWSGTR